MKGLEWNNVFDSPFFYHGATSKKCLSWAKVDGGYYILVMLTPESMPNSFLGIPEPDKNLPPTFDVYFIETALKTPHAALWDTPRQCDIRHPLVARHPVYSSAKIRAYCVLNGIDYINEFQGTHECFAMRSVFNMEAESAGIK